MTGISASLNEDQDIFLIMSLVNSS